MDLVDVKTLMGLVADASHEVKLHALQTHIATEKQEPVQIQASQAQIAALKRTN